MATRDEVIARLRVTGAAQARRELLDTERGLEGVGRAAGGIERQAERAERGLRRASDRRFSGGFSLINRSVSTLGTTLGVGLRAGARAGATALALTALSTVTLGRKLVSLATDAGETASKFATVFGDQARAVSAYNNSITKRFGLTTKSLQDATSTFGVFAKAAGLPRKELAGFSTSLVQAGLDLGSFYNASSDDVFLALRSGLSGEAEPLRQFGIFMSDAGLQTYATAAGIKKLTKDMSDGEKVALRQRFILSSLGDAQGDLSRTSGGLANQQRALRGRLTEMGTILGTALLPVVTDTAGGLNRRLIPAMEWLRVRTPDITRKAGQLADKVTSLGTGLKLAFQLGGVRGVVQFLDEVTGGSGRLVAGFDRVVAVARDVKGVLVGVIAPEVERRAGVLGFVLGVVADHAGIAAKVLMTYVQAKFYLKVATIAATIASTAYGVVAGIAAVATGRHTAATVLNVGATRAQAVAHRTAAVALGLQNGVLAVGTGLLRVGTLAQRAWTVALVAGRAVASGARVVFLAMWAAATGPIGLVVLGIAAVVAILVVAYRRSDTFRRIVNNALASVLGGVANLIDGFAGFLRLLGKIPGFDWADRAARSVDGVADKVRRMSDAIREVPDKTVSITVNAQVRDQAVAARVTALRRGASPVDAIRAGGVAGKLAGQRAGGGPVERLRPYVVGERGWEVFTPQVSGWVTNQQQAAAAAAELVAPRNVRLDLPVRGGDGATTAGQSPAVVVHQHFGTGRPPEAGEVYEAAKKGAQAALARR